MDRNHALSLIREAAGVMRDRYGVSGARLFGSVARGDSDAASDVDIAVTFATGGPPNVMAICGVSGLLASRFGVDVDVVAEPAMDPMLNEAISRDGIRAF